MKKLISTIILLMVIYMNLTSQDFYYHLYGTEGFITEYINKYSREYVDYYSEDLSKLDIDSLKSLLNSMETKIGLWSSFNNYSDIPLVDEETYNLHALVGLLCYTELLKRKIDSKFVYYNGGSLKKDLGYYKEAIQDFTKSLKPDTTFKMENYIIIGDRGRTKYLIEDYYGAISDLSLAIDSINNEPDSIFFDNFKIENSKPSLYFLYIDRAKSYLFLNNYNQTISDISKDLLLYPECDECYYIRGFAYYYDKKIKNACLDMSKAGELGYSKAYDFIKDNCIPKSE